MIWGPVLRKLAVVVLTICAVGVVADRMGLLRLERSVDAGGISDSVTSPIALEAAMDPSGGIAAAVPHPPNVQSAAASQSNAKDTPPAASTVDLAKGESLVTTAPTAALPPPVPIMPMPVPPPPPPPHLPLCATEPNTDRPGHDLDTFASQETSPAACCTRCSETQGCSAWTFVHDSSTCWLKGTPTSTGAAASLPPGVANDCCTSGVAPGVAVHALGGSSVTDHIATEDMTRKGAAALRGGDMAVPSSWKPPSMVIAIPTIPRHKGPTNIDYLTGTVESLVREALQVASQHPSNLFSYVELLVLSHVEDDLHPDFVALRTKYAGDDEVGTVGLAGKNGLGELRLRFLSDGGAARNIDPHRDDQPPVDDRKNPEDRPGVRVRQQSKDVVALIMATENVAPDYVLFTEDDAELCVGSLSKVASAIEHANRFTAKRGAVRMHFLH